MTTNPERSSAVAGSEGQAEKDVILLPLSEAAKPTIVYKSIDDVPEELQAQLMQAMYDTLVKRGALELSGIGARMKGVKLTPLRTLLGLKGEQGTFAARLIESGVARIEDGKVVLLSTLVNNPPATYEEAVSFISTIDEGVADESEESTITELAPKSEVAMPEPSGSVVMGVAPAYKKEEAPKLKRGETVEEMEARKEAWMREFYGTISKTGSRKEVYGGVRLFSGENDKDDEIEEGDEQDGASKNAAPESKDKSGKTKKREDYKVFLRELKGELERSKGGRGRVRKNTPRVGVAPGERSASQSKAAIDDVELSKKRDERVAELANIPIEKRTLDESIEIIRLGQEKIAQTYNQIQSTGNVNTPERHARLLIMILEANEELIGEMKKMYDALLPVGAPIDEVAAKRLRESVFSTEEQSLKWLVKESNQLLRRTLPSEVKLLLNKTLESAEVVEKGFREVFSRMYPESIMYQRAKSELPEYLFVEPSAQSAAKDAPSLALMLAAHENLAVDGENAEREYGLLLQQLRAFGESGTDLAKLSAEDRVIVFDRLEQFQKLLLLRRGKKDPVVRRLTILVKLMKSGEVASIDEIKTICNDL